MHCCTAPPASCCVRAWRAQGELSSVCLPLSVSLFGASSTASSFGSVSLGRVLLKSNGNMIFRDQHADVFSRWMYPIAYVGMMLFFYTTLPEQSESSTTDNHAAGVPAYCSGRGSNMLAGLEL